MGGKCKKGVSGVSGVSHTRAVACKIGCPRIHRLVCGSDGKTYSNKCYLDYASCKSDGEITIANEGKCKKAVTEVALGPAARYEPMDCEPNSKFVDDNSEKGGAKWDCECDPDGKKA